MSNIQLLYRRTNMVMTKKGQRLAPVFLSTGAAHLLARCPKFSYNIGEHCTPPTGLPVSASREAGRSGTGGADGGGKKAAAPGDVEEDSGSEAGPAIATAVPASSPSARRPTGAKRFKASAAADRGSHRAVQNLADSVQGVRTALSVAAERKTALAGLALETKLVELLEPGADKQRRVRDLLRRTQELQSSSSGAGCAGQAHPTPPTGGSDDDEEGG